MKNKLLVDAVLIVVDLGTFLFFLLRKVFCVNLMHHDDQCTPAVVLKHHKPYATITVVLQIRC